MVEDFLLIGNKLERLGFRYFKGLVTIIDPAEVQYMFGLRKTQNGDDGGDRGTDYACEEPVGDHPGVEISSNHSA